MMLPMRMSGVVWCSQGQSRGAWVFGSGLGFILGRGCTGMASPLALGVLLSLLSVAGCSKGLPTGGPLPTLAVIGETGKLPGQFGHPRCIDNDGTTLWVLDRLARVQQFDVASGKPLQEWRTPKGDRGKPTGITIWKGPGTPTLLCIADTHEARVLVYGIADETGKAPAADSDGRPPLLATFGAFGEDLGLFVYPTDVAIISTADGTGISRMYVSEYGGNDRVTVWEPAPGTTPNGAWVPSLVAESESGEARQEAPTFVATGSFGSFGSGPDEFNRPQSLAVWGGLDNAMHTSDDELIVNDACNHRVGRFTLDGKLKQWYGGANGSSDAPGAFSYPYGLCLLDDNTALISEFGNNRVQRIDLTTGDCLGLFGEGGRLRGQLVIPWGITVMNDKAWVLDTGNARVQSFQLPRGKRVVTPASMAPKNTIDGDEATGSASDASTAGGTP
jgi:hypothetical protein